MVAALSLSARLGLLGVILVGPSLSAQTRSITFPDTLGANFAIADSAREPGSATNFDFLVGTWHFTFQGRKPDGTFYPPFTGHWFVTKRDSERYTADQKQIETVFVEDQWRPDDADAAASAGTYTYRAFSSQRHLWTIQGINTYQADWEPGLAWGDATNRYLVQHYGPAIERIRYFAITPTQFLWRADRSSDGGKTWLLDHWTMQATRIAK
jgi:hypothetical protein